MLNDNNHCNSSQNVIELWNMQISNITCWISKIAFAWGMLTRSMNALPPTVKKYFLMILKIRSFKMSNSDRCRWISMTVPSKIMFTICKKKNRISVQKTTFWAWDGIHRIHFRNVEMCLTGRIYLNRMNSCYVLPIKSKECQAKPLKFMVFFIFFFHSIFFAQFYHFISHVLMEMLYFKKIYTFLLFKQYVERILMKVLQNSSV